MGWAGEGKPETVLPVPPTFFMTHTQMCHTHLNKKRGRNEPMFVVINGSKDACQECQTKEKKDAASPRKSGKSGR